MFKFRSHFSPIKAGLVNNPSINKPYIPCREAIARMIACLLTADPEEIQSENYEPEVSIDIEVDISPDLKDGLIVGYQEEQSRDYFKCLSEKLTDRGIESRIIDTPDEWKQAYHHAEKHQEISTVCLSNDKNKALIILHQHVAKFLYQICQIWKYHQHPYFCELYAVLPENFKPILPYGFHGISKGKRESLNMIFAEFYRFLRNFARFPVSNVEQAYEFFNRHIEMIQLKPSSNHSTNSKNQRIYDQLDCIFEEEADIVRLISEYAKINPNARIGVINPENPKEIGGGSLTSISTEVEEILCRISNYIAKLAEQLPANHSYKFLIELLMQLEPKNQRINLNWESGVYFLKGKETREYIAATDIPAYVNLANQIVWLVSNDPNMQHFLGGEKTVHKVENVSIQLESGEIYNSAVFISFAGIDGRFGSRERDRYFNKRSKNFFQEDIKALDEEKAIDYYRTMWRAAFQEIVACDPPLDIVFLNPIETGATDPTPDKALTTASAKALANVVKEFLDSHPANTTQLVLSLVSTELAELYKQQLDSPFSDALEEFEVISEEPSELQGWGMRK